MRVLFVCLGNICRSPAAEGALRAKHPEWEIDSAGLGAWHAGKPPHPPMVAAANARGLDLSGQRARQVRATDFETFDMVLAMDRDVLAELRAMPGGAKAKHFGQVTGQGGDVPDPYYTGDYEGSLTMIIDGVSAL